LKSISIIILCSIIGLVAILILICFINRRKLIKSLNKLRRYFGKPPLTLDEKIPSDMKQNLLNKQNDLIDFNDLSISKMIKKGRFSTINEGIYQNNRVAIKILSDENPNGHSKALFEHEKQIYSLPFIQHENILK
jgi:hypothetical protein